MYMKLYSRQQMAIGIVAGAVLVSAFLFGAVLLATQTGLFTGGSKARSGLSIVAQSATSDFPAESATGTAVSSNAAVGAQIANLPTSAYNLDESENINVYEKFNEAVVNITTEIMSVNWFMDPVPQSGGSGSGSIIDAKGYVLTNYHVVKGAYKLFVNTADGNQYEAKLVGADSQSDIAVIKFNPPSNIKLHTVPFGTAKNLKVGQKVLAIGNPFGLERTLTRGIVSGLGRPIQKDDSTVLQNMIQTDASINPGNSGGPLFNARGEMIGINTMIYSPSGGSVGIGFAIPIDSAARIIPELIKYGKVIRGWIDMDTIQLFPALTAYLKQEGKSAPVEKGLLVSSVKEGGDADKAGIKGGSTAVRYGTSTFNIGGDIIVSVNGYAVASLADLNTALDQSKPGEKIAIEYFHGSQKIKGQIVLSERAQQ
jgi:S1-C subfamily serine protease